MASSYYDNLDMNVKTVAERCREYYKPADFVVIMNIDDEDFSYTIQHPENVVINQPSPVTKELYYSKEPDNVTMKPGQTRLVAAYEADWMIKSLMDKMIFRNRAKVIAEGNTPSESAVDPATQHRYIKQIYQGKKDFMDEYNKQLTRENAQRESIGKELDESAKRPTRQAQQAA